MRLKLPDLFSAGFSRLPVCHHLQVVGRCCKLAAAGFSRISKRRLQALKQVGLKAGTKPAEAGWRIDYHPPPDGGGRREPAEPGSVTDLHPVNWPLSSADPVINHEDTSP
ncbi:MAG: hypothetical protein K2R98_17235 [Gemmataceae bacterium]|nr:hypothetical protein [Gemmataceae bacterium]